MRVSAMWLGAIVVSSVIGGVVVVALITTSSGGDNRHVASATPTEKRPVKVVITGTESAKEEVTDGGIAGLGMFKASGAITDRGTVTTYRG